MPANKFTLPFIKKELVAKDTFSFFFDRNKNPTYDFVPGQYNRVILPHENPDDRGTSRFFTVSSSPLEKNHLIITTKVLQSTYKKAMLQLEEGQEVQFFGPLGSFVLDVDKKQPRIYLAGGIGLTPFHSMFMYSAEKNIQITQSLFVSFSTADEMVFHEELSHAHEKNNNLTPVYTVTRPDESNKPWDGEVGRINEELIKKHVSVAGDEIYYICGPTAMVDGMREMVEKMDVPQENIVIEHFSGY